MVRGYFGFGRDRAKTKLKTTTGEECVERNDAMWVELLTSALVDCTLSVPGLSVERGHDRSLAQSRFLLVND